MIRKISFFIIIILLLSLMSTLCTSKEITYLTANPKRGDGLFLFLQRYGIPYTAKGRKKFKSMNRGKFNRKGKLLLLKKYTLPIEIKKFNSKSIRSSIGITDYNRAKNIEIYNDRMFRLGVKPKNFRKDKILWVPLFKIKQSAKVKRKKLITRKYPIFGKKYETVKQIDNKLEGCIYYLVSGHGGPDPGAVGKIGNIELHEDEYAYDVTLRLARKLLEHSATVYMIVQDPNDGIRSSQYLNNSYDEYYHGRDAINKDQKIRLKKRVDIVNKLNWKNRKKSKLQQMLSIHVDSRSFGKRIDIFFYHNSGSKKGKKLANILQETLTDKYEIAQPGRGYHGSVSDRSLYVIRKSVPTCILIELANIRNKFDQKRLIIENNRQAIANWLCEGLINAANKMKK